MREAQLVGVHRVQLAVAAEVDALDRRPDEHRLDRCEELARPRLVRPHNRGDVALERHAHERIPRIAVIPTRARACVACPRLVIMIERAEEPHMNMCRLHPRISSPMRRPVPRPLGGDHRSPGPSRYASVRHDDCTMCAHPPGAHLLRGFPGDVRAVGPAAEEMQVPLRGNQAEPRSPAWGQYASTSSSVTMRRRVPLPIDCPAARRFDSGVYPGSPGMTSL